MKNKNLKQEIDQNFKTNEVFTRQSASDLLKVDQYLSTHYQEDLCIRLTPSVWHLYEEIFKMYPNYQTLVWRQYIASQMLSLVEPSSKQEKASIKKETLKENLFKFQFLIEKERATLRLLKKHTTDVKRIHFLMNGLKDEAVSKALSYYLNENVPQTVMIYMHGDSYLKENEKKNPYWEQYDYFAFDEYQEGKASQYRKQRQIEKK